LNASNSQKLALPKPRRRAKVVKRLRAKSRPRPVSAKRRKEQRIVAKVLAEVRERDGSCRLFMNTFYSQHAALIGPCEGETTPAHLAAWRRSKTRGQHSRKTIIRLCERHHRMYDTHEFDLAYSLEFGGDGAVQPIPHVKKGAAA